MLLVVFPNRGENPFPVKIEKDRITSYQGIGLCVSGMGAAASCLDTMLASAEEVSHIVECGTAAIIRNGDPGTVYECVVLYNTKGTKEIIMSPDTPLAQAACITGDEPYYADSHVFIPDSDIPLLYTMETLRLYHVAKTRGICFTSIRLATDNGTGDLRAQCMDWLNRRRSSLQQVLYGLRDRLCS